MHRDKPTTNEIYHVYNRGVEKRAVFMDDRDYLRFIHDLFEFNDQAPTQNLNYYFAQRATSAIPMEVRLPYIKTREPRKLLVELLVFCLMPNHFHLMVRQKTDGGVTEFMRKLGTGYTNYFNQKYRRVGSLFQGKYKLALIKNEQHFLHLPYYIHSNPLDISMPEWRERTLKDRRAAFRFLQSYRWSSLLDYIGIKNFPSVTQRDFLLELSGDEKRYRNEMMDWLKDMDFENVKHIALE